MRDLKRPEKCGKYIGTWSKILVIQRIKQYLQQRTRVGNNYAKC